MFRKTLHAAAIFVAAAIVGVALAGESRAAQPVARGQQPAAPPVQTRQVYTGAAPVFNATAGATTVGKPEKIASVLDELQRVDALRRATGQGAVTAATAHELTPDISSLVAGNRMRIDAAGRVDVWADTGADVSGARASLEALGMIVQRTDDTQHIVQGSLLVAQLNAAAALPSVVAVRLPQYAVIQTGSVNTQGDTILGTADLRSKLTASGAGVRVGIISDGMEGLASSQGTSDLGTVDTTTCNMVSPSLPTSPGAGAEGTAMAEIVHDLAPGAQLMYGYFGANVGGHGTPLDFNAAVNCLAAHNDVVVDDVGWFDIGPYDGTNVVSANTSAALNNVANPIRGYYTAVANQAQNHYHAAYTFSGYTKTVGAATYYLHRFAAGGGTTDGTFGLPCAAGVFCGDAVALMPGGSFQVLLQWNDPWGASTNDYDLLVFDNTSAMTTVASSNRQNGGSFPYPYEEAAVTNNHGVDTLYGLLIGNYNGLAASRSFDMYVMCSNCYVFNTGLPAPDNLSFHNFNTLAGSVPAESDAGGGVVSAGAIDAANSPSYNTIEFYSSRGPTADARTKPDITGIDCVAITGAAGFFNPFCGTSAAAPHIAGIAALLLSCNPTLLAGKTGSLATATARNNLRTALLNGAVDLGTVGSDNTFGAGRANTANSAPLAGCVDTDGDGYPDGLETTMSENPTSYCATMRGDVNGDGRVNIVDLSAVALFYNQNVPTAPPRDDQGAAPDGKINIIDLSAMAGRYNQFVSSCP